MLTPNRLLLALAAALLWVSPSLAQPAAPRADLHAPFDSLLSRYLERGRIRYLRWWSADGDRARLTRYVDSLEAQAPNRWSDDHRKAYWINLYNAATLELVLEHYPIESIKDIGSVLRSPWKKKVAVVEGRKLSLDDIEHNILRKQFPDARIHFALNCASIGCPPLFPTAFRGDSLDAQLDRVTHQTLQDPRFVQVKGRELHLTRLFDWYRRDFDRHAGSTEAFLARFRDDVIADKTTRYWHHYLIYDWSLNEAR